jgi:hypothetical protein
MTTPDDGLWLLACLARIEQTIGMLYTRYAARFSTHRTFWMRLAADEGRHADWIWDLHHNVDSGLLVISTARDNRELYFDFLDYLATALAELDQRAPTLAHALATATFLESTYLERGLLTVLTTDAPEVARVLEKLADGTEAHRRAVEKEWRHYQARRDAASSAG